MEIEKYQAAIEAILFTMGDSVEIDKIAAAIGHDEDTTRKLIHNMMDRYEEEDRGIRIIELDNSYQFCTKKEMYEYLIRVAKQPRKYTLTDVLLETLSIVAYRQPVTKLEIEKIRGVKSDHAMNKLVEYGLIEEAALGGAEPEDGKAERRQKQIGLLQFIEKVHRIFRECPLAPGRDDKDRDHCRFCEVLDSDGVHLHRFCSVPLGDTARVVHRLPFS